jgi:hypothetical protein
LRSDVPGSQRSLAIMTGEEHYHAFGQLLYSVQTGRIAFDKLPAAPVSVNGLVAVYWTFSPPETVPR